MLTNRGAKADTSEAWDFYRRVREQFVAWNHVVLTFREEPDRPRAARPGEFKIVQFVDDQGHTLELEGINFGYGKGGGTPGELLAMLEEEGFDKTANLRDIILNPAGTCTYPQTIIR